MHIRRVVIESLLLFGHFAVLVAADSPPTRPNILLIMTDDQGWGDVEFSQQLSPNPTNLEDKTYVGHPELKTPSLNSMVRAGMQFNRFYTSPLCRPTRAGVLTGRHFGRTGISMPGQQNHLLNRELTIAELAKTQGYTTGLFGKWHLGALDKSIHPVDSNIGGTDRLPSSATHYSAPWNHGFDTTFATESKTQTFNPTDIDPPTHYWTGHEQFLPLTDPSLDGDDSKVIVDNVIPFIQRAVESDQPFMATVWFHSPHWPYDTIDQATLNEFYTPAEQAAMDENEKGYYASITAMDQQIGRLRREIHELGLAEDTLIVFSSDNGPFSVAPFAPYIDNEAKGGLRGDKGDLYEGGVRVPAIIEWEGQVAANSQTDAVGGVVDLLPTILDVWDLELPDDRPLDGETLIPVLTGTATQRSSSMKLEGNRRSSIVDAAGRYKAISNDSGDSWELYDLIRDPKETNNLSSSNPAKLNELSTEWNTWKAEIDDQRNNETDYDDYISSTTNATVDASNPVSFELGEQQSNTATVFVERQFATLELDLQVDSDGSPAKYDSDNLPSGATIDAGTVVDSYLVHFDHDAALTTNLSLTFDEVILGVIGDTTKLKDSDFLAFANPDFESSEDRGSLVGESTGDSWEISDDGGLST